MKAVLYCRVSTEEQAKRGYSLSAQEVECRRFAESNGFIVDACFVERGESAKNTDRTQLQKLLEYCRKNEKTIAVLIVWRIDRLARHVGDFHLLARQLHGFGVRILSVTETNEDSATGNLMRNIFGSFAQYENELRSERTKQGLRAAIKSGRWTFRVPYGYTRKIGENGKTIITPAAESEFVIEAYRLALTGMRQFEIAKKLRRSGCRQASSNLINRILTNGLYCGLIQLPWLPEPIVGIHETVITQEEFYKVQRILKGDKPDSLRHRSQHPDFPLRGLVYCSVCETKLTAAFSRGRHGGRYPYYFCRNGCSVSIRKEEMEELFYQQLQQLQPSESVFNCFALVIRDVWMQEEKQHQSKVKKAAAALANAKEKKGRLDDLLIRGIIDEATYKERVVEFRDAIVVKQIELSESKIDRNQFESCLEFCRHFMLNVSKLWAAADCELKSEVQNYLFPQGIFFDPVSGFRTPAIPPLFNYLSDVSTATNPEGSPSEAYFELALRGILELKIIFRNLAA